MRPGPGVSSSSDADRTRAEAFDRDLREIGTRRLDLFVGPGRLRPFAGCLPSASSNSLSPSHAARTRSATSSASAVSASSRSSTTFSSASSIGASVLRRLNRQDPVGCEPPASASASTMRSELRRPASSRCSAAVIQTVMFRPWPANPRGPTARRALARRPWLRGRCAAQAGAP